jgi:16S rRNA G966 N2-methylase RsmD
MGTLEAGSGEGPPSFMTVGSMSLSRFVKTYLVEAPAGSMDTYDVDAYSEPIHTTKVDPIYNFHPYDSKKSHSAIAEYINHYCTEGDVVLDPFCGSGSALVAASSIGCPSIGIDFSPLAAFISNQATSAVTSVTSAREFSRPMLNHGGSEERWGLLWRPYLRGMRTVKDFFTPRNLTAISLLRNCIGELESPELMVALSSILAKCSHLMAQNSDGIGRVMKGTYYVGVLRREVNVWQFFAEAYTAVRDAKVALSSTLKAPAAVSRQSSVNLSEIPNNSIDYVFTDPPYSGKVQFGELNFLREAALNLGIADLGTEIIVNDHRGFSEQDWAERMAESFREVFRVLKPGRWATLCYHDTSDGTWQLLQDLMRECGFEADTVEDSLYIETKQKSIKQITATNVAKRDLVINFKKPRSGQPVRSDHVTEDEESGGFAVRVRALIADFLSTNPGSAKDDIFDHVVGRMVRAGTMEAHNFEEHLAQVAEPVREPVRKNLFEDKDPDLFGTHEVVRWYLKSTLLDVVDAAESVREDRAAEKLRSFIQTRLDASPWLDGVHYSDLLEHFIFTVHDKPRRPMAEWLLDYLYKTDSGMHRLPATDEEARLKAEGRSKGTGRRIKRYIAFLEQGVAIPAGEQPSDATLADWIRHAKLSGMYAAGKMLFERGGLSLDRLPEEAAVAVEEDYQVCVRMLSRQEKK